MVDTKSPSNNHDNSDMEGMNDALTEKIKELFRMCDQSSKGYVVLADLFRLKDELGLDNDEVEKAFVQLDADRNNSLSLEEFLTGFGLFLGVQQQFSKTSAKRKNTKELKPDFAFQVFNLIDKEDKGHITKQDLEEAAQTLEINVSQIDYIYSRLKAGSEIIHYEDFVNNIGSIVALSPALQEIKEIEDQRKKSDVARDTVASVFKMDLSDYDDNEVETLLYEQATLLFKQCDYDNKNYVTKEDLLTLSSELSLETDIIGEAFERLDIHNNGYLTLREFVNGFGLFLGIERDENGNEPMLVDSNIDKIKQLFNICDTDSKGYVTRYDLNRLTVELGISKEEIESIFTKLDSDSDGFITLEEFVHGFSNFMFDDSSSISSKDNINNIDNGAENGFDEKYFTDSRSGEDLRESLGRARMPRSAHLPRSESEDSRTSERLFISRQMSVAYETGTTNVDDTINNLEHEVGSVISKEQLKDLWNSVSGTGDHMTMKKFEDFLHSVYSEIRDAREETRHLETVLEKKSETHSAEIKRIYDEVEMQLQAEKAKQLQQERLKEQTLRDDLCRELESKEKQIDKFMQRQQALERRLDEVKDLEQTLKYQNSKLLKENSMLEDKLNDSMSNLEDLKSNLHNLEMQTSQEKKETLKAAFQATQGIQYEHENLVKQLDLLKSVNQKLRDDRDTIEASLKSKTVCLPSLSSEPARKTQVYRVGSNMEKYITESSQQVRSPASTSTPKHSPLKKQGSILSDYFDHVGHHVHEDPLDEVDSERHVEPLEAVDEMDGENTSISNSCSSSIDRSYSREDDVFKRDDMETDFTPQDTQNVSERSLDRPSPSSPRHPPIGMNDDDNISVISSASINTSADPRRIYKIVFVGDSGVGKSSFIHRFCFDDFRPNFTATIGVDYQIKTIKVNKQVVALQLWDTAGQERFRSITKQYFRRADGVVVMFDLSSWSSYTNVKGWMLNIEDGAEPDCVVMLLGNKQDLVTSDESLRKVAYENAVKLAKEYNADYHEVSARSGEGVAEAVLKMAKKMEATEDSMMKTSVLNLDFHSDGTAKKKCCR